MANPLWRVNYYQVGCARDGKGESAILIVENRDGLNDITEVGTIFKAILIDGGMSTWSVSSINETVSKIKKKFSVTTAYLQFDAVVLTHWDVDHVNGFSVSVGSLLAQAGSGYNADTKIVGCFKYNMSTTPPKSLTRIYCPYWCWEKAKDNKSIKSQIKSLGQKTAADSANGPIEIQWTADDTRIADCLADPRLMLGANVVTGRQLAGLDVPNVYPSQQLLNLDQLLTANDPWTDLNDTVGALSGCPGLYIFGARGQSLGTNTEVIFGGTIPPSLELTETPIGAINEPTGSSPTEPQIRNMVSIMMLLVWKSNPATMLDTRISLYTGGDAEWENEQALADWISNSNQQIETIKIGHHGSQRGTSTKLLETVKPKSFLVSAGFDFNHPFPEVLWEIDAYLRAQNPGSQNVGAPALGKALWPTCYPYWLAKVEPGDLTTTQSSVYTSAESLVITNLSIKFCIQKTYVQDFVNQLKTWYTTAGYSATGGIQSPQDRLDTALTTILSAKMKGNNEDDDVMEIKNQRSALEEAKKTNDPKQIADAEASVNDAEAKYRRDVAIRSYREAEFQKAAALTEDMMATWSPIGVKYHPYTPSSTSKTSGRKRKAEAQLDGMNLECLSYICASFYHDPTLTTFEVQSDATKPVVVINAKKTKTVEKNLFFTLLQTSRSATNDVPPTAGQVRRAQYTTPTYTLQLDVDAAMQLQNIQSNVDAGTTLDTVAPNPVHLGDEDISPPSSPTSSNPLPSENDDLPLTNGASFSQLSPSDSSIQQDYAKVPASYITLDDLIATLNQEAILFQNPTPSNTFESAWKLNVDSTSDMVTWMQNSFDVDASGSDLVNIQLWMSGPAPAAGVTSFFSGFDLSVTYVTKTALTYSSRITDVATAAGSIDQTFVSNFIGAEGLLYSSPGVVFGLNNGSVLKATTWPMQELFRFIVGSDTSQPSGSDIPVYVNTSTLMYVDSTKVNCIWFSTIPDYSTIIRLTATSMTSAGDIQFFNPPIPNCSCTQVTFHGRRRTTRTPASGSANGLGSYDVQAFTEVVLEAELWLLDGSKTPKPQLSQFTLFVSLDDSNISVLLRPDPKTNLAQVLADITTWIVGCIPSGSATNFFDKTAQSWLNTMATDSNLIAIREASVDFTYVAPSGSTPSSWQFVEGTLTFEVDLDWGIDTPGALIPTLMTFSYTPNKSPAGYGFSFTGRLWREPDADPDWATVIRQQAIKPQAPLVPALLPRTTPNPTNSMQFYISFKHCLPADMTSSFPSVFPTAITEARLRLSATGLNLRGTLGISPSAPPPPTSAFPLTLSYVTVNLDIPTTGSQTPIQASFAISALLSDRFQQQPAQLQGEITYANSAWMLTASLQNLKVSNLYTLFPSSDGDAVMNALDSIEILDLDMTYNYDNTGSGSGFVINASLIVHTFYLTLLFSYPSADRGWTFSATLDDTSVDPSAEISLGDVLRAISPSVADALPAFLDDFEIGLAIGDSVSLNVIKPPAGVGANMLSYITTAITVKTKHVEFSYLQASPITAGSDDIAGFATKRILRLILEGPTQLPSFPPLSFLSSSVSSVPFLDNIESPFQRLELLWTNDSITKQELDTALNPIYTDPRVGIEPILYQDPTTQTRDPSIVVPNSPQTNQILAQGAHIIVVAEQNRTPTVILDYCFSPNSGTPPANVTTPQPVVQVRASPASATSSESDNESVSSLGFGGDDPTPAPPVNTNNSAGAMANQQGMLSITGLAIGYDTANESIEIKFNARVQIGPVEAELQGFGITFPVTLFQTRDLTSVSATISGMAFALNKPPIIAAGDFLNESDSKSVQFEGGLAVTVDPYSFIAAGYYGSFSTFRSMLVFAQLTGPFLELEFGTLSGLTAGFGYHSSLTLPTVDNVTQFPFLGTVGGTDVLTILTNLTTPTAAGPAWFTPSNGPIWFAAGLTATLFQALSIDAVVVVDMQQDDTILGIFADCQASVPAGNPDPFLFVDMGIVASVDFGKGTLQVEGQLTPRSFVFSPSCKLSGGFALCYWFEGSGHEGDWVFTVGGYHPAFQIPTYYPNPKRLAIVWTYDDNLTISGDAYFAITPKLCMGGGALTLAWSSGRLNASLNAYADFLMNFKPFHYIIDAGVNVLATFTIGWGSLSHTFHLDASASISMTGPPIAGVAHIDWSVISFTVHFGPQSTVPPLLGWSDFTQLLLQSNVENESTPPAGSQPNALITIKATAGFVGDYADTTSTSGTGWLVEATNFTFRVTTLIPSQSGTIEGSPIYSWSRATPLYFKPMGTTSQPTVSSNIAIVNTTNGGTPMVFTGDMLFKNAPIGLWGPYDASQDPSYGNTSATAYQSTATAVPLCFGMDVNTPLSNDVGDVYAVAGTDIYVDCFQKMEWDPVGGPPAGPALAPPTVPDSVTADTGLYLPKIYATTDDISSGLCNDNADQDTAVGDLVTEWLKIASPNQPNSKYAQRLQAMADARTRPGATQMLVDYKADVRALPLVIA